MSDIYFKASLQNTLNPEVGTFDNVGDKEGTFTLEDGEYYLTNNTGSSYRVYYPTKHLYSVGFTIEFDINYNNRYGFSWCLLFTGDESTYWHGFGVDGETLQFRGQTLPNYHLIASPNTWLHVKCIFNYNHNQNYVDIYIDNVKVNNFIISKDYGIKYIDILGNSVGYVPDAKIKNITIYNSSKHYLNTIGLAFLWLKIKSLFATKTELASKANTSDLSAVATSGSYNDLLDKPTSFDVDLSNYYTKNQIDILLSKVIINQQVLGGFIYNADIDEYNNEIEQTMKTVFSVEPTSGVLYNANIDEYSNETEQTMKTVSAVVEPTSVNAYTIVENSDTVEEL